MKLQLIITIATMLLISIIGYGQKSGEDKYSLFIPKDMLRNEKFVWGLERVTDIPDDNPDYTILLQEYRLYFKLGEKVGDKEKVYYFKYRNMDNKNYIYASEDQKGETVSFLIGSIGLPSRTIAFNSFPSDINNEVQPLQNLLKDAVRSQIFSDALDVKLLENINIMYRITATELPVIIIGNNSSTSNISFDTPTAYYYVDMSGVEDRDMLIKELNSRLKSHNDAHKKFFVYVSSGNTPIIIKNMDDFNRYNGQLWTHAPAIPSPGFDKDEIRRQVLQDILYSTNEEISFHFYLSDKFFNVFAKEFISSLFPVQNKESKKLKLYIHLEPKSENDSATSFTQCQYVINVTNGLSSDCLKKSTDLSKICKCE